MGCKENRHKFANPGIFYLSTEFAIYLFGITGAIKDNKKSVPKRWSIALVSRALSIYLAMFAAAAAAGSALPPDVQAFVAQRDVCEHFRGEPWASGNEPEVKERREFIFMNIKKFCAGTDKRLADLRRKYRDDPRVIDRLGDFEDTIEAGNAKR